MAETDNGVKFVTSELDRALKIPPTARAKK